MATINVRRDVTDPFYRYKMERLQSKIEGKGNGIKTVIVNLTSVAGSLARPPACESLHIAKPTMNINDANTAQT
jgi:translation initiation factor 5